MSKNNIAILTGHLGKDPDTRQTASGTQVVTFSLASNDGYFNREKNEWVDVSNWHNVVTWRKLADECANLKKGDKVTVFGMITNRSWEKEDGTKAYITEVVADTVFKHEYVKPKAEQQETKSEDDIPF